VHRREPFHPPTEAMLKYDADRDGKVTAAEFNAGLHAEFAAADINHDGVLDPAEVRAVNEARIALQASAATPLIDWNDDGHVDFHEFAAAPRALFEQIDQNSDGVLDKDELHPHHYEGKVPQHTIPPGAGPQ
jgi:Ca2+-binding EF-hand superfamily protein